MFCPKCGNSIDDGASFCVNCGSKVDGNDQVINPVNPDVLTKTQDILNTKKKSKLPIIITVIVCVIAVLICCLLIADKQEQKRYIDFVKSGSPNAYPDQTYGEAFENFFANPKWEYFEGEEGQDVVEFTGDCTYMDQEVTATLQFILDTEEGTFETGYFAFNDVPQNQLMTLGLITAVFGDEEEAITDEDALSENEDLTTEDDSKKETYVEEPEEEYYEEENYEEESYEEGDITVADFIMDCSGYYEGASYNISFSSYSSFDSGYEVGTVTIEDKYTGDSETTTAYYCEYNDTWDGYPCLLEINYGGDSFYLGLYEDGGLKCIDFNSADRNWDYLERTETFDAG